MTITVLMLLTLFAGCGSTGELSPGVEPGIPVGSAVPADTAEFSRGSVDESTRTYISDYLGLRFALPEGWRFASAEELSALVAAGADSVYAEESGSMQEVLELTTVYDMMAVGGEESIAVLFENLKFHIGGVSLTEAAYAEALADQLTATEGFAYTVETPVHAQLAGLEGTLVNASVEGSTLHQSYFIRKMDERMLVIIFTAAEGPAWESFKTCFAGA